MSITTREESAGPLGVVGSLTAGFEVVGRHLGLIALPVLMDLFLWLGPRISVTPLVEQFIAFLVVRATPDPATNLQITQAVQMLRQFGERANLLSLLGTLPLLHVPSLLAHHGPGMVSPLGVPYVVLITSLLGLTAWGVVLIPVGLVVGFLYLSCLAGQVRGLRRCIHPLSEAEGEEPPVEVSSGLGRFTRVLLFAAALLITSALVFPVWVLLVGTILAMAPLLGFLVWTVSIGLGSYIVLHLLFVVPGVLLGGRGLLRATWESILLIHTQFPSVVGLVLLMLLVSQGLGFVWSLPSGESWSLLVGILGNGCIATGLTAALFVFYQERVGQLVRARQVSQ